MIKQLRTIGLMQSMPILRLLSGIIVVVLDRGHYVFSLSVAMFAVPFSRCPVTTSILRASRAAPATTAIGQHTVRAGKSI